MEWHAHIFNGKSILDNGRTTLLGNGTKLRNFVAASDVAHFALLALTAPAVGQRVFEIGGPGNFSANEVAQIYANSVGIAPRITHVPRAVVRLLALLTQSLHPGLSRVLRISALADDAFPETFDPTNLTRGYPMRLTSLHEFVRSQVAQARSGETKEVSR